ncbi:MAG: VCBS repeat-containing protein [Runella sp.]
MMKNTLEIFILCFILVSCQSPTPLFEQLLPQQTGIDFENRLTETEEANILAYEYFYNGGGVAVGDFNNDGLPDLYFTANQLPNRLYLNKGGMKFEDITKSAFKAPVGGMGANTWKTGVTLADVNADGWLDIYVCYSGNVPAENRKNQLFINTTSQNPNQSLSFEEKAQAYDIADAGYSTQGLFFDYDADGDLDLFVLNHNLRDYQRKEAAYLKTAFDADAGDRLYRNEFPQQKFTDVTKEAGIISNALGFGLGVAADDLDGDNRPDLYVCNDYVEEDYLYLNNGNGTFSERGKQLMGHFSYSTMGVDIADINNDARPDVFTTDMLPEDNRRQKLLAWPDNWNVQLSMLDNGFHWQNMRNMLHLNSPQTPSGGYSEIGQAAGVQATDWSWAGLLADFDNDGRKDLFVSNGFVRDYTDLDFVKYYADQQLKGTSSPATKSLLKHLEKMPATPTHHYIFRNTSDSSRVLFSNETKNWGFEHHTIACGAVYADLDQDGDLDLITCNTNEPAKIYRNLQQQQNPQHYLKIKLKGAAGNPWGVGAKVYVYAQGQIQYQAFMPTRGFQSCMYDNLHFGLGQTSTIDSVRVLWPSDKSELILKLTVNQVLELDEKNAVLFDFKQLFPPTKPLLEATQTLDFTHRENPSIDFNTQILLPYLYSYAGPRLAIGDLNADGLEDIYVCGASNQSAQLFLQNLNGSFAPKPQSAFAADAAYEDRDAVFFDAEQDGDLDLYVVSGEYNTDYALLQDRLYLNDGRGNFTKARTGHIPELTLNKSCVVAFDADQDGDMDLFLGGGVQPANFPYASESFLLKNNGKGTFTIAQQWDLGLTTDALAVDLDNDKTPEVVVTAEWKPIQILRKSKEKKEFELQNIGQVGFWSRIAAADLDNDGHTDLVVGNWGINTPLKASENQPVTLYYDDFDQNGRFDPFLAYYIGGQSYPLASRDEALEQLLPLRKTFTDYKSYAAATAEQVLGKEWSTRANKLFVTETRTGIFWNDNGKLSFEPLPFMAQVSPVYAIALEDFDADGGTDILLAGNQSKFRIRLGKTDANHGVLLKGLPNRKFEYISQNKSGLNLQGDVRDMKRLGNQWVFGINDASVRTYHWSNKK